jgi:hypothetical protein
LREVRRPMGEVDQEQDIIRAISHLALATSQQPQRVQTRSLTTQKPLRRLPSSLSLPSLLSLVDKQVCFPNYMLAYATLVPITPTSGLARDRIR